MERKNCPKLIAFDGTSINGVSLMVTYSSIVVELISDSSSSGQDYDEFRTVFTVT